MPPALPSEVLKNIVDTVRDDAPPEHYNRLDTHHRVYHSGATLASLMQTSKAFNNLAAPRLYQDCLVEDAGKFLASVKTGAPFDSIERLQLSELSVHVEVEYDHILQKGWEDVYPGSQPNDSHGAFLPDTAQAHLDSIVAGVAKFKQVIEEDNSTILPKLKRVTLGDLGDLGWNRQEMKKAVRYGLINPQTRSVAHMLLDRPTVEHLCQYTSNGPLSLSGAMIQSPGSVKIFTYHPRPFHFTCFCDFEQPPIVLGAVNRYLPPMHGGKITTDAEGNQIQVTDPSKVSFKGTVIEVYDFIRIVHPHHPSELSRSPPCHDLGSRPALSLSEFENDLQILCYGVWGNKIQIRLFNREDAPPCSACGLDINKEWAYHVDRYGLQRFRYHAHHQHDSH